MRLLSIFLLFLLSGPAFGQVPPREATRLSDTTRLRGQEFAQKQRAGRQAEKPGIEAYKIISHAGDTTVLDTSLTIRKEYRYNYLRRDDFELMPFSNVGQPYNRLGANLNKARWFPGLGARARHFNYFEVEDIAYYNVATPMTELFFKTTFEQGQLLDALLTFNTSRRLNFSIAYKGFRSLGKYREDEVSSGNFRATSNYVTQNGRYRLRAHIATQEIEGQENGGLLDKEVQFESEDDQFSDRRRIDVLFQGVTNKVVGKRYYLDHQYRLLGTADSTSGKAALTLGHRFAYETKFYQYRQGNNGAEYFGEQIFQPIDDKAYLKTFYNRFSLGFGNRALGDLEVSATLYQYDYYFTSILQTSSGVIPNRLNGEEVVGGARWDKGFGRFRLRAEGGLGLSGDLTGSFLDASMELPLGKRNSLVAGIHHSARKPDFNFLLYQSDYLNYNWDNSGTFENEQVQSVFANFRSAALGEVQFQYSSVENHSFFRSTADAAQIEAGEERAFIRPFQQADRIGHLRVKYEKEFRWRKWALNNTLLYQEVDQSSNVLNVPSLITRNTLYFSSDVFKKAMFLQTGVTFKYFTEYTMDAYNPLMGEFFVQERESLGGFPLLDFFINAKVRQTRIYLKAEHFNSSFTGNRFYSAPNYPYRDFVIRFGLVWNFFS